MQWYVSQKKESNFNRWNTIQPWTHQNVIDWKKQKKTEKKMSGKHGQIQNKIGICSYYIPDRLVFEQSITTALAPSKAHHVVVFPLCWWFPPQETAQPHQPPTYIHIWYMYTIYNMFNQWIFLLKSISSTFHHFRDLPGPWFNKKMSSYQYRKSHCGDKTVVRSSYLHNGISYAGKMTSFYWISPQKCKSFIHSPYTNVKSSQARLHLG